MNPAYRVADLSEEVMGERMAEVLALEATFYHEFGLSYSHEIWTAQHFLHALPGKWELSKIAFDSDEHIIAFWIASHDEMHDLRGHRGGTDRAWRRSGVWRDLFERIRSGGRKLGLTRMSHTVNADNPNAVRAWKALGFRILSGDDLLAFRERRQRRADRIEGDRLISPDGHAYYALYQDI